MSFDIIPSTTLTMSTREIAELTGKKHSNVTRDFKKQCEALEIPLLKFEQRYLDKQGAQRTEYVLDQVQTMNLITGYNVVLRDKVNRRWLELEQQVAGCRQWLNAREDLKIFWHDMNTAMAVAYGDDLEEYSGAREQNMIYKIAFGMTAKQIIASRGSDCSYAKDCMTAEELELVAAMESANTMFLYAKQDRNTRKEGLRNLAAARRKQLGLPAPDPRHTGDGSTYINIFASDVKIGKS